ncbi:MAG: hypothetical protein ISS59_04455 [Desulfobacteraceae bacterium]|nr:hypothetical protein [Desulfobacteraceae bacterium]
MQGQFLVLGSEEHLVREIGFLQDPDNIRNVPIKAVDGMPISTISSSFLRNGLL